MKDRPITWDRALGALALAGALLAAVMFVAANFVLVDVRLWGLNVETRLAWAVVVPAALGFAAGLLYARLRASRRARTAHPRAQPGGGDQISAVRPSPPPLDER